MVHSYSFPLTQEMRDDLASYIYDEWKSVHGVKNRWTDFDVMSDSELVNMAESLEAEVTKLINAEKAHAELVRVARENPDRFVTDINPFYDMSDAMDQIHVSEMERYGNFEHVVVFEKPVFVNPAIAEAFKRVA